MEKVMTIYSSVSRARYVGNGVTKNFTVPFYFQANKDGAAQLGVYVGDSDVPLREGTDYTVNGVNNSNGGEIVFAVAPQNGVQIAINRNIPIIQETKFKNGANFPAESYEQSLDKVTMQIQEVKENLARAIVLPPTSDEDPLQARNDILAARDEAVDSASAAAQSESAALNSKNASANSATQAANSANVATTAKNTILNDAGFQVVAADLSGENKIGYVADNLDAVAENVGRAEQAATAASEAAEQAVTAASEAQATIENETAQALQEIASNATSQTQAFNSNATNKTTAFNNNAATKQSQVDASASAAAGSATSSANSATSAANSAQSAADTLALIEPAVEEGLVQLANASNALRTTQITNCLLENPQLVNLTLSDDGTLTLKAGSTVIVPYGTSAPTMAVGDSLNGGTISDISWDGSKLFYYVRYSSDKTLVSEYTNTTAFAFENGIGTVRYNQSTDFSSGSGYSGSVIRYNTDTNIIGVDGYAAYCSFPFAIITAGATSDTVATIDQTFQSIGYIGSTVWVGKGVKGLAPNGRNEDGSLKNTVAELQKIATINTIVSNAWWVLLMRSSGLGAVGLNDYYYDENTNITGFNSQTLNYALIASYKLENGVIRTFNTKPTFHAVDYSDFQQADKQNVKLTGDQTISSVKTLKPQAATTLKSISNVINDTVTPTGNQWTNLFDFNDVNGVPIGRIGIRKNSAGMQGFFIQPLKDGTARTTFSVLTNGDTNEILFPDPGADSNGDFGATTRWVRKLFTGSLATNGYVKIPISGSTKPLIIQWGHVDKAASGTVTFPIPFTANTYGISSMPQDVGGGTGAHSITFQQLNLANFTFQTRTGSGGASSLLFRWIAIGY